ncbi:hypothetical protein MBN61_01115 [Candidatus Saccharibacteria bacterium]|nr:hypothetical protein [Candidatus Saccharibacteria bacterium]
MKDERSFNKSSAINQSTKSDWDDAKTKVAEAKDSVLKAMNHSLADKKNKVARKAAVAVLATAIVTTTLGGVNSKKDSYAHQPAEEQVEYTYDAEVAAKRSEASASSTPPEAKVDSVDSVRNNMEIVTRESKPDGDIPAVVRESSSVDNSINMVVDESEFSYNLPEARADSAKGNDNDIEWAVNESMPSRDMLMVADTVAVEKKSDGGVELAAGISSERPSGVSMKTTESLSDSVQPKHLRTEPRQPKHLRTEPLAPKHLAADLDESVE